MNLIPGIVVLEEQETRETLKIYPSVMRVRMMNLTTPDLMPPRRQRSACSLINGKLISPLTFSNSR